MTNLRPYKFVVHAIVQEIDDDGMVIGEKQADPAVLFGCEALSKWASEYPDNLAKAAANREASGLTDG